MPNETLGSETRIFRDAAGRTVYFRPLESLMSPIHLIKANHCWAVLWPDQPIMFACCEDREALLFWMDKNYPGVEWRLCSFSRDGWTVTSVETIGATNA